MALTTPILYTQSAFDATNAQTFLFGVVGGDQVTENQLTIINQATNAIVYQETQTTFLYQHTVPAGTLTNGVYYSASVITYNANGTASSPSSSIQFYCYSTPTFVFSNIPTNNVIRNTSYNFEITYDQTEDELLNSYSIVLYDAQQIELATSGVKYVGTSLTPPTVVSYLFSGLNDDTNYYIQGFGQTIEGTNISTELIEFIVNYETPNLYSAIELSNNCSGGYVTVQSNLIGIDGESYPIPPVYADDNTVVDTTEGGYYVKWDSGYNIVGDFVLSLWGRDFNINSTIINLSNSSGDSMIIAYRQDDTDVYVDYTVISDGVTYYIYSPSITAPLSTDTIQIYLKRIGQLYEIDLYNLA